MSDAALRQLIQTLAAQCAQLDGMNQADAIKFEQRGKPLDVAALRAAAAAYGDIGARLQEALYATESGPELFKEVLAHMGANPALTSILLPCGPCQQTGKAPRHQSTVVVTVDGWRCVRCGLAGALRPLVNTFPNRKDSRN